MKTSEFLATLPDDDKEEAITDFMEWARGKGCAVTVWLPEELRGTPIEKIEEDMVAKGWDTINFEVGPDA